MSQGIWYPRGFGIPRLKFSLGIWHLHRDFGTPQILVVYPCSSVYVRIVVYSSVEVLLRGHSVIAAPLPISASALLLWVRMATATGTVVTAPPVDGGWRVAILLGLLGR